MIEKNTLGAQKNSWLTCIALVVLFMTPYWLVNHLPIERHAIPFMLNEDKIPFLPWTFVIYLSPFFIEVLLVRNVTHVMLRKVILYVGSMVGISLLFFILIPIEYPRDLSASANTLINHFWNIDSPGNCFPSLHVSVVLFLTACYDLIEKSKLKKILMWLWAIAIIISVLTTKQHYLIDVVGGIALAVPFFLLFKKDWRRGETK